MTTKNNNKIRPFVVELVSDLPNEPLNRFNRFFLARKLQTLYQSRCTTTKWNMHCRSYLRQAKLLLLNNSTNKQYVWKKMIKLENGGKKKSCFGQHQKRSERPSLIVIPIDRHYKIDINIQCYIHKSEYYYLHYYDILGQTLNILAFKVVIDNPFSG